jgi:UDP-glucose 4-epimerase
LLNANNSINIIGTRHGEKLYETLLTREEMANAEDMGDYYRVPADNRDLNYDLYVSEGNHKQGATEDYHSHNAKRLNVEEMMTLLIELPEVKEAMTRRGLGGLA